MSRAEYIDGLAARVLMVSFFIPSRVQVFIAAAACFYLVGRTIATKQWGSRSLYKLVFLSASLFFIYLLAVPFTPQEYRKELLHICERMESLILLPLAFAIIGPPFRLLILDQLVCFVYGCIISCMVSNADFIAHYLRNDSGTHPLSHVLYRMYFEAVSGIHPTYMSMYLCFSVCILLFTPVFNGRFGNLVRYTLLYGVLVLLLSLLAKAPLIAMIIILVHAAWMNRAALHGYWKMIIGGLVAVLATGFAVPFFRQRMWEIVQFLGAGGKATSVTNSFSDRTMIFTTDKDMLLHYWLTGVGPGRLLPMLRYHYFFHSLSENRFVGYFDPHNQYFAVWLSFGVLGLLLLVAMLVYQLVMAVKMRDHLYLYLLIILSVTFFTESVLYRQQGVVFYTIFTSLLLYRLWEQRKAHRLHS